MVIDERRGKACSAGSRRCSDTRTLMEHLPRGHPATREDLAAFAKGIDQRMDALDQRMDGLDKRLDRFELSLGGMRQRVDGSRSGWIRCGSESTTSSRRRSTVCRRCSAGADRTERIFFSTVASLVTVASLALAAARLI